MAHGEDVEIRLSVTFLISIVSDQPNTDNRRIIGNFPSSVDPSLSLHRMLDQLSWRLRSRCHPDVADEQPRAWFRALGRNGIRTTLAKHFNRNPIYLPDIQQSRYIAGDAAGKGNA